MKQGFTAGIARKNRLRLRNGTPQDRSGNSDAGRARPAAAVFLLAAPCNCELLHESVGHAPGRVVMPDAGASHRRWLQ